ncbi:iron dicitrate transport regulator FecR [uncultured Ramlibacter sp.]|uniref:iron dicitrate transport regulator FecR n=1 Tax=uncultured Ramlibacter sp. TaxID=260755 RepID=UPI002610DEF7|nr:iron dicitrate transport regulator FecR [uncultured Ramlibacter sp.]
MTQHILQGRSEAEVTWFQRRSFLQSAAAWTALGGFSAAHAQQRSNIVELVGDATVNGTRVQPQTTIQTGDAVATGPGSSLVFVIGNTAFQVRQNSRFAIERGATLNSVSVLRMLSGAIASVWGRGTSRQILTPTLTAGIRGTGVYTEVRPEENYRSYFCNCYGVVTLGAGPDQTTSRSVYHQAFWGEAEPKNGHFLLPAKAINHTDEELEFLARLADQQTAWQISGRKGVKDAEGYQEQQPPPPAPPAVQR